MSVYTEHVLDDYMEPITDLNGKVYKWAARIPFAGDESLFLSVVAGEMLYSSPRETLCDHFTYTHLEVALVREGQGLVSFEANGLHGLARYEECAGGVAPYVPRAVVLGAILDVIQPRT